MAVMVLVEMVVDKVVAHLQLKDIPITATVNPVQNLHNAITTAFTDVVGIVTNSVVCSLSPGCSLPPCNTACLFFM